MQTTIIVGIVSFTVIGLLIFILRRSAKNEGRQEEKIKSQQGALDIRKDADEFKSKTKDSPRSEFLDM